MSADDSLADMMTLRYIDKAAQVIVQGNRNGDGKGDFEILAKVSALSAGDCYSSQNKRLLPALSGHRP
jgi:hypothetical protein